MRRRVIWVAVVVAVLVGGAVVVDSVVRGQAEQRIAGEVTAIPGVQTTPHVSIGGFPFLTQLAGGSLQAVHVTAPAAMLDGLRLQDVVVDLTGVSTQPPYTASDAVLTASTTPDDVERVLSVDLDLAMNNGKLVARTEVLGLPLDIVLVPRAAGREVEVDITEFLLAGFSVSADELPAGLAGSLEGMRFPVDGLPTGMVLTDVTVADDGLRLRAEGTGLDLMAAAS